MTSRIGVLSSGKLTKRRFHAAAIPVSVLALFGATMGLCAETQVWSSTSVADREIMPGQSSRFPFIPDRSFEASYLNTPVFVTRGASPGPTLCLSAGIHGDELNGVEIARRVFAHTDAKTLKGTLIGLPAINSEGVRTGNRYMSDRREAARAGVMAIIYEAGEPLRFQEEEIARGVEGVTNVMTYLEMIPPAGAGTPASRVLEKSQWIRAKPRQGGFFFPSAKLGDVVEVGDTLGMIVEPFSAPKNLR